jgi:hypothetical protein
LYSIFLSHQKQKPPDNAVGRPISIFQNCLELTPETPDGFGNAIANKIFCLAEPIHD